ncbi:MAG: alpha-ketoacid dehydrogenase subunit beta [Chloroflexota bacterium]|nr:alpha-ketoacid dehydrogenase subunit beta [Dehalococcoidia bacterium]MDW8255185.1 alpha-ketoacid dehydrogenase subunit beta [Chloroflexota bacterium]
MAIMTYRDALNQALREEMLRDENVYLMGEDIGVFEGAYKVTQGLLAEFGEKRVRDTPIAEEGFVGAAIGSAMLGLRPVVEIMTINFSILAMDQIVNNAAKIFYMFGGQCPVPMVIRTPGGGGQQLTAQHSQSLEVWYAHVPGLKVVAPAFPADAKGMLKYAIRQNDPVMFIEHLALYNTRGEVPDGEYLIEFGKAQVVRPGKDLSIFAHSRMTLYALEAAKALEGLGISAEVVDLRSLRPYDLETLVASVKRTNRALYVEEGWGTYGIGAEICAAVTEAAFDYLDAPIGRVAGAEVPMPYSKPLERAAIPSPATIVAKAKQLLNRP